MGRTELYDAVTATWQCPATYIQLKLFKEHSSASLDEFSAWLLTLHCFAASTLLPLTANPDVQNNLTSHSCEVISVLQLETKTIPGILVSCQNDPVHRKKYPHLKYRK